MMSQLKKNFCIIIFLEYQYTLKTN